MGAKVLPSLWGKDLGWGHRLNIDTVYPFCYDAG